MLKSIVVCAVFGFCVNAAHASPFALDMWVYEFNTTGQTQARIVHASTSASAGTPVPDGCTSSARSDGDIDIECSPTIAYYSGAEASNLGIDVNATVDPEQAARFEQTIHIGFNRTDFVCTGAGFVACPTSPLSNGPAYMSQFDYETGSASYFATQLFSENAWFNMSPTAASMSGDLARGASGVWDYGNGGTWFDSDPDPFWTYGGRGVLIQAPAAVPLPASGVMLLSALGLLVARIRRLSKRRTDDCAGRSNAGPLLT